MFGTAKGVAFNEPAERRRRWRVSAGYSWRSFDDVTFKTGSYSQHALRPAPFGSDKFALPLVGVPGGVDNRLYDDGFLLIDVSGAADGLTWNWGYAKDSQVAGDTLKLRNSSGFAREVSSSGALRPSSWSEEIDTGGPYVQVDYLIDINDRLSIGPQFGISHYNLDTTQNSSTFHARQTSTEFRVTVDDEIGLNGVIPPLAPYAGSFEGPGPLLPIVPDSRRVSRTETGFHSLDYVNAIEERLDADIVTLSPGVNVEYANGSFFGNLSLGVAVNIVDWEAHHNETLFVSRNGGKHRADREWSSRNSGTDVLVGAFVQGAAGVAIAPHLSISGFVRYDWSQDLSGKVGPSSFDVDMSGLSAGVMATIQF